MSRPISVHAAAAGEGFVSLLPSKPIQLPFEGSYARVQVIYNMDRVMELPARRSRLLRAQNEQVDGIAERQDQRGREFDAAWADYRKERETADPLTMTPGEAEAYLKREAAYVAAWREYTDVMAVESDQLKAVNRDSALILIGFTVDHLVWPFPEKAPDPEKAESWDVFSDTVLHWMVAPEGGLKLATEQMRSPLLAPS